MHTFTGVTECIEWFLVWMYNMILIIHILNICAIIFSGFRVSIVKDIVRAKPNYSKNITFFLAIFMQSGNASFDVPWNVIGVRSSCKMFIFFCLEFVCFAYSGFLWNCQFKDVRCFPCFVNDNNVCLLPANPKENKLSFDVWFNSSF